MTFHLRTADPLVARILRRDRPLFAEDVERHAAALRAAIDGRRILVVGASGSIGAAFVRQLAGFAPAALHLVDINENTLVEVVRDLRSGQPVKTADLRSVSIDFGSLEYIRFVAAHGPYDVLVNFSAVKHVRSERDPFSLMRMLDVNVRALHQALEQARPRERVFSVSTDKSVRPANVMGATKNLMEQVLFCRDDVVATSARFANVAFSAGSLLEGFEHRLVKGQPLAAPTDIHRWFISHEEAGQLCLLAAFLPGHREVCFPRLDHTELRGFDELAVEFLSHHSLTPLLCASEDEARAAVGRCPGQWPCHFVASDTTGEKAEEEFFRLSDQPDFGRFRAVGTVAEAPARKADIEAFLAATERIRRKPVWEKAEMVALVHRFVPDMNHEERHRVLEQKM